jgi:hypothetical protein
LEISANQGSFQKWHGWLLGRHKGPADKARDDNNGANAMRASVHAFVFFKMQSIRNSCDLLRIPGDLDLEFVTDEKI